MQVSNYAGLHTRCHWLGLNIRASAAERERAVAPSAGVSTAYALCRRCKQTVKSWEGPSPNNKWQP